MIRSTTRRSRRLRHCTSRSPDCTGIAPGDRYVEMVASPNHDDLGNTHWWRLDECVPCWRWRTERPEPDPTEVTA